MRASRMMSGRRMWIARMCLVYPATHAPRSRLPSSQAPQAAGGSPSPNSSCFLRSCLTKHPHSGTEAASHRSSPRHVKTETLLSRSGDCCMRRLACPSCTIDRPPPAYQGDQHCSPQNPRSRMSGPSGEAHRSRIKHCPGHASRLLTQSPQRIPRAPGPASRQLAPAVQTHTGRYYDVGGT